MYNLNLIFKRSRLKEFRNKIQLSVVSKKYKLLAKASKNRESKFGNGSIKQIEGAKNLTQQFS